MFEAKVVIPGEFAVSAQPLPENLEDLAEQGFTSLISNRPDNEAESQPSAATMRDAARRHGLVYVYIPVTVDRISMQDIDKFQSALKEAQGPAIAHCGTGKRAYLLWAAGEVLYHERSADELIDQANQLGLDVKELHQVVANARKDEVNK